MSCSFSNDYDGIKGEIFAACSMKIEAPGKTPHPLLYNIIDRYCSLWS